MSWKELPSDPLARAFEALYERHSRELWGVAYARWLDADLALDVVQEAFLRLWKEWRAGREIVNPSGWLVRVTHHLAEDLGKSAFRRHGTQPPDVLNSVWGREGLPLDSLQSAETFGRIRAEVEKMPLRDRQILTLRYGLDYNTREIARLLRINPSAVHMRLSRARQRLSRQLGDAGICTLDGAGCRHGHLRSSPS